MLGVFGLVGDTGSAETILSRFRFLSGAKSRRKGVRQTSSEPFCASWRGLKASIFPVMFTHEEVASRASLYITFNTLSIFFQNTRMFCGACIHAPKL